MFSRLDANSKHPVNILIGARKFIEGWNNYRVSSIGLINFGRAEGSQIIQFFGRGVRLKGKDNSLKRSKNNDNKDLHIVETLNIFGLNADYMKRFYDDLIKEGVKVKTTKREIPIIIKDNLAGYELLTLQRKKEIEPFHKQPSFKFEVRTEDKIFPALDLRDKRYTVTIDGNRDINDTDSKIGIKQSAPYLNWNDIYLQLIEYKRQKAYYNLIISRKDLMNQYLKITFNIYADEFLLNSYLGVNRATKFALNILKQYITVFYNRQQKAYEGKQLETVLLDGEHPNLKDISYQIEIQETDNNGNVAKGIDSILETLDQAIHSEKYPEGLNKYIEFIDFEKHLYKPLLKDKEAQGLRSEDTAVKLITSVTPSGLNKGESDFIDGLDGFVKNHKDTLLKGFEIYLLRNLSKKGFGFYFETAGGFYPDFMLWIRNESKQYLAFIDPHGLRNEQNGFQSEKIKLSKDINTLDAVKSRNDIELSSFILTPTPPDQIAHFKGSEHAEESNVYYMNDRDYIDKMVKKILKK